MGSVLKLLVQILLLLRLLMGFMGTVLSDSTTDPGLCVNVTANLHGCADHLRSGSLTIGLPAECCDALRRMQDEEATLGVQQTCQCAKDCLRNHILPAGFSVDTINLSSSQIQSSCGLYLSFSLNPYDAC